MAEDNLLVFPMVNRIEVVDATGRAFVAYYGTFGASVSIQDDGRTLKVFADKPVSSKTVVRTVTLLPESDHRAEGL